MKKSKVFTSALVATLLLSGAGASTAFAANGVGTSDGTTKIDPADTTKGATDSVIKFTKVDGGTVNPDKPIVDPNPVHPTSDLTLMYVTNKLDFDSHTVSTGDVFAAKTGDPKYVDDTTTPNGIISSYDQNFALQVLDARAGTVDKDNKPVVPNGWHVTGKQTSTSYAGASKGAVEVAGVKLSIPAASASDITKSVDTATVAAPAAEIGAADTLIMSGDAAATGFNTRINDATKINLTVPKSVQQVGQLDTVVTWTLAAGPNA